MANYPKLLNLSEAVRQKIISYLNDELVLCYMERGQAISDIEDDQRAYWAKSSTERRNFPFKGASNIIIPLIPIAVEAVHSRNMQQLKAAKPIASVTMRVGGKNNPLANLASADKPFEDFIDYELGSERMNFLPILENSILEIEKLGTGVAKGGYEKITKKGVQYIGEERYEFDVVQKDGPVVDSVPLSRFLMPFVCQDPQKAPWCGEEHSMMPVEVKALTESGMFYPDTYDKLLPYIITVNNSIGQEGASGQSSTFVQETLENRVPVLPKRCDFVEIWASFDVDEDGRDEEIQILYHRMSYTVMAVRYNWYIDLRRPYRRGVYIPVEHRFFGLGICRQAKTFQQEITTIHRQRLDNATLANMRMFKVSKLSGYGPKEPIFPGKMWFLDDMDHIDTIQMGEIYPSAYQNEQASLMYEQQRVGINDITLGMPSVGTPGTATGDLARIQEGNKKIDYTFDNITTFTSQLIKDTVLNIKQFGNRNAEYFTLVEGGELVQALLDQPIEIIKNGLLFEIGKSSASKNKMADRQNWTQLAAMFQQYFVGSMQLAQVLQDPMLIQTIARKGLVAVTEAMSQILDSYDVRNKDRMLLTEIATMLSQTGGIGGPQQLLNGGGNNGGNGSAPPDRIQLLQEAFKSVAR